MDNLEEMNKFLEPYKLVRLNHEEIENMKRLFQKKVESISYQKPPNKEKLRDFPGGTVVKNPPANAGDMGSSPGLGRSHKSQSN